MKRSFMIHFEITQACMEVGLSSERNPIRPDVLDNLATKLRCHPEVRRMLKMVERGELDKVIIGVGREIQTVE